MDERDLYIKKLEEENARLQADKAFLQNEQSRLQDENALLQETIKFLNLKLYGRSSEKTQKDGDRVLNEAEEKEPDYQRKKDDDKKKECKRGDRKINSAIPRIEKHSELKGSELRCCTEDETLEEIGRKVKERLDLIPAKFIVNKYIEHTYKCRCCGKIVEAKSPKKIIEKGDVDSKLLASILVGKYEDHIPLYRYEEIFNRLGLDLTRSTTSRWVIKCAEAFMPLINLMKEDLAKSEYVQCDETRVQVLREKGRAATKNSYMWVLRNARPEKPMVIFNYEASRSNETALTILDGIKGAVQTDGYKGYNGLPEEVLHLACWAHVRRKFDEAVKAGVTKERKVIGQKKKSLAEVGCQYVNLLYQIMHLSKKFKKSRRERATKLVTIFNQWLLKHQDVVAPKSYTGKAIKYTLGIWEKLVPAAINDEYELDNNLCENAIRPFAIGRKNWLFACAPRGADASANIYSLIQSAKMNNLCPEEYLFTLLEEIPNIKTVEEFEKFLPYNWKPSTPLQHQVGNNG